MLAAGVSDHDFSTKLGKSLNFVGRYRRGDCVSPRGITDSEIRDVVRKEASDMLRRYDILMAFLNSPDGRI